MGWIEKLKNRWGVQTLWDVLIILTVFACTGFSIVFIKHQIGVNKDTFWLYRILFYIAIFILYQPLLLLWGFAFGKFQFFWSFEKKFFKRLAKIFTFKK